MARTDCCRCDALPAVAEGRCITCYQYLRRNGVERPLALTERQVDLNQAKTLEVLMSRFWAKVDKHGPVCRGDLGPCWSWSGALSTQGYGRMTVWGEKVMAHRFAYQMLVGGIPKTYELDHLCRNHSCVRPTHLEAVTHKENVRRGRLGVLRLKQGA